MRLTDMLTPQRIKTPLTATTKPQVLAELVDVLVEAGGVTNRDKALAAVLEREQTRTTGIGNALAIPHGKTGAVGDLVLAIGKAATPIEFDSIDGKPVTLLVMLISPVDRTGPHIQALARISRLFSIDAFRNKLHHAKDPADMWRLLQEQEEKVD